MVATRLVKTKTFDHKMRKGSCQLCGMTTAVSRCIIGAILITVVVSSMISVHYWIYGSQPFLGAQGGDAVVVYKSIKSQLVEKVIATEQHHLVNDSKHQLQVIVTVNVLF